MKTKKIVATLFANVCVMFMVGQDLLLTKDITKVYSEQYEQTKRLDTIFKGKTCLKLDGTSQAVAMLDTLNMDNFKIEVDIAGEVMSGIGFRVSDMYNYHFLYFRTFLGGTDEAIQYVPIYNGALSWVFLHISKL